MHSVDHPHPSRQRGPHNDASMLDGDSGHGNPGEPAGDEWAVDTDTDVVDQAAEDELDDAVADPTPETDDEVEEFEAGTEPDAATAGPSVDEEEEVEAEADEELEGEAEADVGDVDEDEEAEEEEDDNGSGPDADSSILEEELDRQMDRSSTDPTNPAHHPPPSHVSAPPIDGYDSLTIPQVMERVEGLEVGQLNAVLEYEQANRNRKTLVAKLTRLTRDA